ncbi:MAG: hypothetical protein ACO3NW_05035 [Kiritimatiellia bacterium]
MFKFCKKCQEETLFVSEAQYEGFQKVAEKQKCTVCGTESQASAPPPRKADPLAALFGEGRAEKKPDLFDVEAETARLCRKCTNYVLHPFTQRCGLHDKEVAATDSCEQFEAK